MYMQIADYLMALNPFSIDDDDDRPARIYLIYAPCCLCWKCMFSVHLDLDYSLALYLYPLFGGVSVWPLGVETCWRIHLSNNVQIHDIIAFSHICRNGRHDVPTQARDYCGLWQRIL